MNKKEFLNRIITKEDYPYIAEEMTKCSKVKVLDIDRGDGPFNTKVLLQFYKEEEEHIKVIIEYYDNEYFFTIDEEIVLE